MRDRFTIGMWMSAWAQSALPRGLNWIAVPSNWSTGCSVFSVVHTVLAHDSILAAFYETGRWTFAGWGVAMRWIIGH